MSSPPPTPKRELNMPTLKASSGRAKLNSAQLISPDRYYVGQQTMVKRMIKEAYFSGYSDGEANDIKMGIKCQRRPDDGEFLSCAYWEGYQLGRKVFFASIQPQQAGT